ncbi:MAG: NUDIX hydrolase [Chloroflexota bacterium]
MANASTQPIRAAGGIVWRKNGQDFEVLLIRRARYDDWALPKGKLKRNERWENAALREVSEETGCRVRLGEFAGVVFYRVNGAPKIVLFWNMRPAAGNAKSRLTPDTPDEVSEVRWMPLEKALEKLSYDDERQLLKREARRAKRLAD